MKTNFEKDIVNYRKGKDYNVHTAVELMKGERRVMNAYCYLFAVCILCLLFFGSKLSFWMWFGAIAGLILILIVLVLIMLLRHKDEAKDNAEAEITEYSRNDIDS